MKIDFGQRDVLKKDSSTVDSLIFAVQAKHTTANTAFSAALINLALVTLKLVLVRKGVSYTIYSDQMLPLALASGYKNGQASQILSGSVSPLVAAASGVKEIAEQTYKLNIGEFINLKDGDELRAEISVASAAAGTGVDTAASETYTEVYFQEAVGVGVGIPKIITEAIAPGKSSLPISLGDDVKAIFFLNTDKKTNLTADNVLNEAALYSDRQNITLSRRELEAARLAEHESFTLANSMYNCFKLFGGEGKELDSARVELTMTSTNVAAGANYLIAFSVEKTEESVRRANAYHEKHEARLVDKVMSK